MSGKTEHSDRELLELAAKAAGYEIVGWSQVEGVDGEPVVVAKIASAYPGCYQFWQPLSKQRETDADGDALRLGHKLGLFWDSKWPSDLADFRRAIVRAAANLAIGA